MRLVLFGQSNAAINGVNTDEVRSVLADFDAGREIASIPEAAINAGILGMKDGVVVSGPTLVRPPSDADEALTIAAKRAADIIVDHLDGVKAALSATNDGAFDWLRAGLLTIGGVLLDLRVGERLCERGLVGDLDGRARVWMLPDAPVTVGMTCLHDDATNVGVASMWTWREPSPPLPLISDVATLVTSSIDDVDVLGRLRLRQTGWIAGVEPNFLTVRRDSVLWLALADVSNALVESVYEPVLVGLAADRGHSRLILSRLIFERVLGLLVSADVISGDGDIRRLVWTGPAWDLMKLEAGKEAHA